MEALDSESRIISIDRSRMLDSLRSYPEQIETTLKMNANVRVPSKRGKIERILVAGVGGSAITGDVVHDWLAEELATPLLVCRSTRLPKFVDVHTLAVCVSYSGDTQETLQLFEQARKRKAAIVSVTSGGKLERASKKHGIPIFRVESGKQPRAALPSLVAAVTLALEESGIGRNLSRAPKESARTLGDVSSRVDVKIPHDENEAKQIASQLLGRWVQVLALERNQSLARRFTAELNEMSKLAASFSLIPEFSHNTIEGWPYYGEPQKLPLALFGFRDPAETEFESRLFNEAVLLVAERANALALEYKPRSRTRLPMLMESIAFGDWISYYLAILRGIDPTEIPTIRQFKERIGT